MISWFQAFAFYKFNLFRYTKVFRASVVDTSGDTLTMSITGDPGKNRAFQQACLKFGIVQVARTVGMGCTS